MRRIIALFIGLFAIGCNDPSLPKGSKVVDADQQAPLSDELFERKNVVILTPAAGEMIKEVQKQQGYDFVRAGVEKGGPTGFIYDLGFAEAPNHESDYLGESQGIRIVVDRADSIYLEGATIDFITDENGQRGFKFDNPNAVDN